MVVTKPGTAFGTFFIQIILGINFLVADCTFFQRHNLTPFFEWYVLHTWLLSMKKPVQVLLTLSSNGAGFVESDYCRGRNKRLII